MIVKAGRTLKVKNPAGHEPERVGRAAEPQQLSSGGSSVAWKPLGGVVKLTSI